MDLYGLTRGCCTSERFSWQYVLDQVGRYLGKLCIHALRLMILGLPIQSANRGVIWDQEIYDPFYYNQDRTFFHSFEIGDCLAGFSFVDEKEAKQFKKKVDDREKNASKATKATPFQGMADQNGHKLASGKSHGRFGLSNLLHPSKSTSHSAPSQPPPPPMAPPIAAQPRGIAMLDQVDPGWRGLLGELMEMGITEAQIEENADFIKEYIEQRKADSVSTEDNHVNGTQHDHARPHPPSAPPTRDSIDPQNTGNAPSKRGPPPAPPPTRGSRRESVKPPSPTPSPPPERTPSPPRPKFRAPPPLANAGKFANISAPSLPSRPRASSNLANPGPPPPPRPPKTALDDEETRPRFGVPPPFTGERNTAPNVPPPPPSRAPLPTSPRNIRDTSSSHAVPPAIATPPPLPPKTPNAPHPSAAAPLPPPLPTQRNASPSAPPPLPPSSQRPIPPPPSSSGPPPPPPLPASNAPPPPPLPNASRASPAPSAPSTGEPPPPPMPPGRAPAAAPSAPSLPKAPGGGAPGGRDDLLASIRGSGGSGGGGLRKVKDSEKKDRSAAAVPGAEPSAPPPGASSAPGRGGGLADALAVALSQRNKKVSASGKL